MIGGFWPSPWGMPGEFMSANHYLTSVRPSGVGIASRSWFWRVVNNYNVRRASRRWTLCSVTKSLYANQAPLFQSHHQLFADNGSTCWKQEARLSQRNARRFVSRENLRQSHSTPSYWSNVSQIVRAVEIVIFFQRIRICIWRLMWSRWNFALPFNMIKLDAGHSIECKLTTATRSPEICFCTLWPCFWPNIKWVARTWDGLSLW